MKLLVGMWRQHALYTLLPVSSHKANTILDTLLESSSQGWDVMFTHSIQEGKYSERRCWRCYLHMKDTFEPQDVRATVDDFNSRLCGDWIAGLKDFLAYIDRKQRLEHLLHPFIA